MIGTLLFGALRHAGAQVSIRDVTVSDVTTRAFSVIWAVSASVDAALVRVFSESAATNRIDGTSRCTNAPAVACTTSAQCAAPGTCRTIAASFDSPPPAAANGVVRVTVTGLGAAQTYHFTIETTVAGDAIPDTQPARSVTTATESRITADGVSPIANDLVRFDLFDLDLVSPATGALLLASASGARHPISAFAGEGFAAPTAVVNLNNLFDVGGASLELVGDEVLQLVEFRGRLAGNIDEHKVVHFRKVPEGEEIGTIGALISQLEMPGDCFDSCDFNCSDEVGLGDFSSFIFAFPAVAGEAAYNPDFDLSANGAIGLNDFALFLDCYPKLRQ